MSTIHFKIIGLKRVLHPLNSLLALFLLMECLTVSCRKEPTDYYTGRNPLRFSTDTVFFDTILSTLNAPVQRFTVHNTSKKPVKISRIYIRPGESGAGAESFRFTVNGDTSTEIRDLILDARDSIFVFVRTGIHLSGQNAPFIVDAYFQCDINESRSAQSVYLYAFGQDAHYWKPDRIHKRPYPNADQPQLTDTQNIPYFIWSPDRYPIVPDDKPYAILGYLAIPAGQTLVIPAGTRLHFGAQAGIWVQKGGKLRIDGTLGNPVRLSGLRLDEAYRHEAGQWGQIWLDAESGEHFIQYAVIENGTNGIWIDSSRTASAQTPGLTIENSQILHMSTYGLMARGNSVSGTNLVIGGCSKALSLQDGGCYQFTHCTFTNYGSRHGDAYSLEMQTPDQGGPAFTDCRFINSIFYGSHSDQLFLDVPSTDANAYRFDHCLIAQRTLTYLADTNAFYSCILNLDPKFHNAYEADFRIGDTLSSVYRKGGPAAVAGVASTDITGFPRPLIPTLGAYEYQPIAQDTVSRSVFYRFRP